MRKTFGKLFIIFGVLLCIFGLYGCAEVAETTVQSSEITTAEATETTLETSETTAEEKETESTSEETISNTAETSAETTEAETEAKTEETSETEETNVVTESTTAELVETTEIIVEETTEETTDNDETLEESFIPDEELIEELEHFLYMTRADLELPEESSLSDRIDSIKSGRQALFLKFSPEDCYYVCGYYRDDKHNYSENGSYCCVEEYTWVGYNDEKKILEKYGDESFAVAFQLNKTETCFDLLPSDKVVPNVEHIALYTPNFENGVNVAESLVYDATYIYLNSSNKNTKYYYYDEIDETLHNNATIPCIELEDQYFIIQCIYVVDASETRIDQSYQFGEYYDSLIDIMIVDKYSQEDDRGRTWYYGLFEIEEFVDTVFN